MSVKLGGPKNYYQDTDAKKLGLKSAENAINKNIEDIATNAENIATNTADITAIKAKDVEQDGKISALEANPVLPTGGTGDDGKVVTYDENGNVYVLSTPAQGGIQAAVIANLYDDSETIIPGETYNHWDGCTHSGTKYICKHNNITGNWDATKWQAATETHLESWGVFVNEYQYIEMNTGSTDYWTPKNGSGVSLQNQAYTAEELEALGMGKVTFPDYAGEGTVVPGHTYSAGDYVMYDDELYVCEATTGGSWDSSKWTKINVMSVDTDLDARVTALENAPAPSGSESVRVLMNSSVNPLGNTNPTLTVTGYKDKDNNTLTAAQFISKIKSGATAYCIITWTSGGDTNTTFAQNITSFSYVNEDTIVFEYHNVSGGNPYVLEVCKFTIDLTQDTAQRERSTITGASGSYVSIYFGSNTNITIPVALRGWSKCKSAFMTGGIGINYLVQGNEAVADVVALDYDGSSKAIGSFLEGTATRRVEFDYNANKVAFI